MNDSIDYPSPAMKAVLRMMAQQSIVESSRVDGEASTKFYQHAFTVQQQPIVDAVITEIQLDPTTGGISNYTIAAQNDEAAIALAERMNEAIGQQE